jgi:hypothetical protein
MRNARPLALGHRRLAWGAITGALFATVGCGSATEVDAVDENTMAVSPGREIFVSGEGNDGTGDGSRARPFRTLQKAADGTMPGDTVNVLDGTYENSNPNGPVLNVTRSGNEGAWITYRALPGHHPKLKFDGWNGIEIHGGASYIRIEGLEVEGHVQEETLEYCESQVKIANPLCNGNGISIDGRKDGAKKPHHIVVAKNHVHHCAGGGVSAIHADYITFEDNRIHDNSWHTRYATSGISILTPWSSDDNTGYKMIVRRNKLWNNKTLVKWDQYDKLSDGNGIIIDTFTGPKNENGDYRGRTLVTNNVSVWNGGSGIHAFLSSHVDIVNNSSWMNGRVVGYAEIFAQESDDVNILNNIMYARSDGGEVNGNHKITNVRYDYNLYFGPKPPAVRGPHDIVGDPLYVDTLHGDHRLKPGSPAIGAGTSTLAPNEDINGAPRAPGKVDIGAYNADAAGYY